MTAEPTDDDLTAAEYVLGTLDAAERQEVDRRLQSDVDFTRLVEAWTALLAPLSEAGAPLAPSDDLWPQLVKRLGWSEAPAPSNVVVLLERQLRRWRASAVVATALAACLAVVTVIATVDRPGETRPLVAVLQATDAPPSYLIRADLGHRSLNVRPVAAKPPAGKSFELWIIDPSIGNPLSLGVVSDDGGAARALPPGISQDVAARATYAITVEPLGGSPTGAPSGAPVFAGHLIAT